MMHPCTPSIIFEWTGSWLAVSQFFMCKRIRTFCCSLHFDVYIRKYLFSLIFILICGSHLSLIELFFHQSYFCWSSKLQTEMLEHGLYYSSHTQYFWLNTCPWIRKPIEYNRSYIHLLFLRRKSWYVIQSLSFSWINKYFWRWSWSTVDNSCKKADSTQQPQDSRWMTFPPQPSMLSGCFTHLWFVPSLRICRAACMFHQWLVTCKLGHLLW